MGVVLAGRRLVGAAMVVVSLTAGVAVAEEVLTLEQRRSLIPPGHLISDFTCALPATGWTADDSHVHRRLSAPPEGLWRIIDYKSEFYEGRAVMTSRADSRPLTIPLNRQGWHAIALGMSERQWGQAAIEVRLTGDEQWQLIRNHAGVGWGGPLFEEPWRFADLTGKSLEIRYPQDLAAVGFPDKPINASLYSVRLMPVRPEHVELLQQKRHRPLVYINDGHGLFYLAEQPGPQIVKDALGRFAGSDWDICAFANVGADLVNYPSAVGTLAAKGGWNFARPGDRRLADNLAAMIARGEDPLRQAIDQAHEQGQKIWIYRRPQAWTSEPPYDHALHSEFFADHPEYRCVEADGRPISKLSIAFPEVRAQLNRISSEALDRGADGLTLALVRGYPCVRYEEPIRTLFQARHGSDPRLLPDTDPRLRLLWAEVMTDWLREIRQLLDKAGPSPMAKRRELSVIVGPDLDWNMRFGFDVYAWARQGLVDAILPYPYVEDGKIAVAEFVNATAGTNVQILPSLGTFQWNVTIAEYRRRAWAYYAAGAHGLSRWDTPPHLARLRLDDPVQQQLWVEHYFPPQHFRILEFAGQNLRVFGPMLGF